MKPGVANRDPAFTLLELLVVIAIISLTLESETFSACRQASRRQFFFGFGELEG